MTGSVGVTGSGPEVGKSAPLGPGSGCLDDNADNVNDADLTDLGLIGSRLDSGRTGPDRWFRVGPDS